MELDASKELDSKSGILSLPLDMSIDHSTGFTDYKMAVHAVAKNGIMETVGRLSTPLSSTPDLPEAIGMYFYT